jgi:hypothetical protein
MWILLATWITLDPNLAAMGKQFRLQESDIIHVYETKEICEFAIAYILQYNDNDLTRNPTFKLHCVKSS